MRNWLDVLETAVVKFYYSRTAHRLFTNAWYTLLSKLDKNGQVTLLNYGFAYLTGEKIPLQANDEFNRYPIQLYHYVASGVPLDGKELLEVGCGRGGGALYIARYMHPRKLTGVDLCKEAIRFSAEHYAQEPKLAFRLADAHRLPFPNHSFDAVLNIESAQHYADMGKFLDEVHRILRPGGHFLMACFEDRQKNIFPRQALRESKLHAVKEQDITANVARALEIDTLRRQKLARVLSPPFMGRLSKEFAGIQGTDLHDSFASGECRYYSFVYRKP